MSNRPVLVTGAAGFIGFHTSLKLLERGERVVGFDNINDYYDVRLKEARLEILRQNANFTFVKADLADRDAVTKVFADHRPDRVINLAAQAGVRYSLQNPYAYVDSNLVGFINILEACRHGDVRHLVYASSSSVYGANTTLPFSEHQNVDHPLSLYAATKKANELMAHTYSAMYNLPTSGLRFFTVYGPWGRPDMALFLFTKGILAGEPIAVFNEGKMVRDFTYVDDIVEGVVKVLDKPSSPNPAWTGADPDSATSFAPYRVYNIGNSQPVELMRYIETLETALGKKAILDLQPMQKGDVRATMADVTELSRETGFHPATTVDTGIRRFVDWYRDFYKV